MDSTSKLTNVIEDLETELDSIIKLNQKRLSIISDLQKSLNEIVDNESKDSSGLVNARLQNQIYKCQVPVFKRISAAMISELPNNAGSATTTSSRIPRLIHSYSNPKFMRLYSAKTTRVVDHVAEYVQDVIKYAAEHPIGTTSINFALLNNDKLPVSILMVDEIISAILFNPVIPVLQNTLDDLRADFDAILPIKRTRNRVSFSEVVTVCQIEAREDPVFQFNSKNDNSSIIGMTGRIPLKKKSVENNLGSSNIQTNNMLVSSSHNGHHIEFEFPSQFARLNFNTFALSNRCTVTIYDNNYSSTFIYWIFLLVISSIYVSVAEIHD